jgi:hypothetical protein
VTPLASGIVGEWVAPTKPGAADTTLLRFAREGSVTQERIQPPKGAHDVPFGPFHVYADTGSRELLCFSFRRGRASPGCRYFRIETVTDASGCVRRQLQLLNWVGQSLKDPEIWTERAP